MQCSAQSLTQAVFCRGWSVDASIGNRRRKSLVSSSPSARLSLQIQSQMSPDLIFASESSWVCSVWAPNTLLGDTGETSKARGIEKKKNDTTLLTLLRYSGIFLGLERSLGQTQGTPYELQKGPGLFSKMWHCTSGVICASGCIPGAMATAADI